MRAVGHCYENSLRQRDPESAVVAKAIRRLACSLNSTDHFPRFVGQRGRCRDGGNRRSVLRGPPRNHEGSFFARERLGIVCDPEATVGGRVFDRLLKQALRLETGEKGLFGRSFASRIVGRGSIAIAIPWLHCE